MGSNFNEKNFSIPASAYPVPMILDTDTYNEIDDQFALIYALLSPEAIDFRGITAAPFLNTRSSSPADGMEKSFQEIVRIVKLMGFEGRVPAFRGSESFLPGRGVPVHSAAAEFIIAEAKRARSRGEKLFVCCIAAITNLASALLIAPDIASDIVVVWLGGHGYEIEKNDEFNLYQDIPASQTVIDSAASYIRIPCAHVASILEMVPDELEAKLADCGEPGKYLSGIFREYFEEFHCKGKVIWDISAVSYFTNPKATEWEVIPREKLENSGKWSFPETERRMLIARKIDRDALFEDIYARLRKHVQKMN